MVLLHINHKETNGFHRIPECQGLKGPGKLIQCNPPMEQEHPDEVTQEGVQAGWNVCTEGDSTTPWAAWARLCHPHPKQAASHLPVEPPVFQFAPIAPCPVTGCHQKSLAPSS